MASFSSSQTSSSSSSSSSFSSMKPPEQSHTNQTIGIAVGLGVGVPILLTIIVLIWVTLRHHKKLQEEDELDKDIDFNGEVSFWSPGKADMGKHPEDGHGPQRRNTVTTTQTIGDADSLVNMSEIDAVSHIEGTNLGLSQMYTPELGFTQGSQENFSRAIHHVYGPSPSYPSTEKLRGSSVAGSMRSDRMGHHPTGSFSSGMTWGGPFSTPPRVSETASLRTFSGYPSSHSFGNSTHPYANQIRRDSNLSIPRSYDHSQPWNESGISFSSDEHLPPQPPNHASQLNGLRESPHPYSNLAGGKSAQSIHTASSQLMDPLFDREDNTEGDSTSDPSSPLRGKSAPPRMLGQHVYHQAAKGPKSSQIS